MRQHRRTLPLAESVQTGQDLGVLVPFQAYTADQKLLVNLAHHRTGDAGTLTGHPRPLTWGAGCPRPCTLRDPRGCCSHPDLWRPRTPVSRLPPHAASRSHGSLAGRGLSGGLGRQDGREEQSWPRGPRRGLPSVSSVTNSSSLGHFHSVLSPRAARHLLSISLAQRQIPD